MLCSGGEGPSSMAQAVRGVTPGPESGPSGCRQRRLLGQRALHGRADLCNSGVPVLVDDGIE